MNGTAGSHLSPRISCVSGDAIAARPAIMGRITKELVFMERRARDFKRVLSSCMEDSEGSNTDCMDALMLVMINLGK